MTEAAALLEVDGLEVQFTTDDGIVRAVNGISYSLEAGKSLGIVGESGCGKSVSSLAVMGLVPHPVGKIVAGNVQFKGRDLGMAVVLITHDLAVVAGFCDEVIVMYAGYIVEQTNVREIFHNPRHPYTIGLLSSMPGTDTDRSNRLTAIPGAPPDMTALPAGCPFAPRCSFVQDKCKTDLPELDDIQPGHAIRCFVDVDTGALR